MTAEVSCEGGKCLGGNARRRGVDMSAPKRSKLLRHRIYSFAQGQSSCSWVSYFHWLQ